ncbi:AAA family ATPase [Nonomuraea rubra]
MSPWLIFRGTREPHDGMSRLPGPPSWRTFDGGPAQPPFADPAAGWKLSDLERARTYDTDPKDLELINAALFLRRPLLVTGKPGVGKSTLALAVAYELGLGPVLRWPVTSRSTLQEGLYKYDAVSRLQDVNLNASGARANIGRYITLGSLGTALLPHMRPRVLLIDEIDKSDLDLPNDLLTVFEEGEYLLPELLRLTQDQSEVVVATADADRSALISHGQVRCSSFPFVVLTSNQEREFPPAFLRRCIQLDLGLATPERLSRIVSARLGTAASAESHALISRFLELRQLGDLATDQLLNALYLTSHATGTDVASRRRLAELLLQYLQPTSVLAP